MIEIVEFFIYTLLKFKVWPGFIHLPASICIFPYLNPKSILYIKQKLIPQSEIELQQRLKSVVLFESILVIIG